MRLQRKWFRTDHRPHSNEAGRISQSGRLCPGLVSWCRSQCFWLTFPALPVPSDRTGWDVIGRFAVSGTGETAYELVHGGMISVQGRISS